ncbi:MAG: hypothetical protein F6K19_32115 [Cyanothece sp. SIO1E1]|nr:hypothetical protein [Cyanothece sp. SIO1E1]
MPPRLLRRAPGINNSLYSLTFRVTGTELTSDPTTGDQIPATVEIPIQCVLKTEFTSDDTRKIFRDEFEGVNKGVLYLQGWCYEPIQFPDSIIEQQSPVASTTYQSKLGVMKIFKIETSLDSVQMIGQRFWATFVPN